MAQRRSLFEVLSIFAYLVAIALVVFSLLNWRSQPWFIVACTVLWAVFSLIVVARLWFKNATYLEDRVLEFPESWEEPAGKPLVKLLPSPMYQNPARSSSTAPATNAAPAGGAKPGLATGMNPAASSQASVTGATLATSTDPAPPAAAIRSNKIRARSLQLQRYRRERFLRYREKRIKRRAAASNLAVYRKKTGDNGRSDNGTCNGACNGN